MVFWSASRPLDTFIVSPVPEFPSPLPRTLEARLFNQAVPDPGRRSLGCCKGGEPAVGGKTLTTYAPPELSDPATTKTLPRVIVNPAAFSLPAVRGAGSRRLGRNTHRQKRDAFWTAARAGWLVLPRGCRLT